MNPVWIRTRGDYVEVLVQVEGSWLLVFREPRSNFAAGEGEVSHIMEPRYITKSPPDPLGS